MLVGVLLSAVVLALVADNPAAGYTISKTDLVDLVSELKDSCLDDVRRTILEDTRNDGNTTIGECKAAQRQIISQLNRATQGIEYSQQKTVDDVAELSRTVQEIKDSQQQVMQLLQQQLTAFREQMTASRKQLTEVQEQLATLQPSCPAAWSRHGQNCYKISLQTSTWKKSSDICAALYPLARLASIHDSESNEHASQLMIDNNVSRAWIGLSRLEDDVTSWSWSDGTPLNFTNWGNREPDNRHNIEFYTGMKKVGTWHDYPGGAQRRSLCQVIIRG